MIPLKLQLKNFLSYGPLQTIDFSTYPLICLSGKNGHGKSALLDAITWALWGQARKTSGTSKADLGLLRLGQTHMLVVLDFEFNGQIYRVRRELETGYGKAVASLDFGIVDPETDALQALTDKTIRATQAKIEQTLHLGFDAFSNSAFLRQGQANEFSKKSPKDRKQIIANILGLDQYENVKKLALDKAKSAVAEKSTLQALQEKLLNELAKKPELTAAIIETEKKLTDLGTQEKTLQTQKSKLASAREKLTEEHNARKMLVFKRDELHKKDTELRTQFTHTAQQWRTIHAQQLTSIDPSKLTTRKQQLLADIKKHQDALHTQLECKQALLKHNEVLQNYTQKLQQALAKKENEATLARERQALEVRTLEQKINELANDHTKRETEIAAVAKQIKPLPYTEKQIEHQRAQFEKRKQAYQGWIAQGNWVKQELTSLQQKQELVHDEDNPSCPLCEQNLSASRKRFLKGTFTKREQFLTHRLARLTALITSIKVLLVEQHTTLENITTQTQENNLLNVKIEELNKTQKAAQEQKTTLAKQLKKLNDEIKAADKKQPKPQSDPFAHDTTYTQYKATHKDLEKKLTAVAYDAKKHAQLTAELTELEKHIASLTDLHKQTALQDQRRETTTQLAVQIKAHKTLFADFATQLKKFDALEDQIKKHVAAEKAWEADSTALQKEKETLLQRKGSLENQREKITLIEKEHKEHTKILGALNTTIDDYHTIATATGKDGIQALLIEDALPEIEQEANELLAKLTNNQAHILIESLRDLKKGGTKETLDIKISDTAGIRPYELFSGGEAFRIDFALRIAISKLLARRAGTSLQTLIIDEGFGSQDEEGLSHIMDAIYKIQDDFAKVIIVSHLNTMKDQFPVHFFVQKGPQGSTVHIMEQA